MTDPLCFPAWHSGRAHSSRPVTYYEVSFVDFIDVPVEIPDGWEPFYAGAGSTIRNGAHNFCFRVWIRRPRTR